MAILELREARAWSVAFRVQRWLGTSARTVTADYPDHVYNLDLTQVPTHLGF